MAKIVMAVATVAVLLATSLAQGPLSIVEDSLPTMHTGDEFHLALHAKGGAPPYQWTAVDDLPAGIRLSADGLLSGRPVKVEDVTVRLKVADSATPPQTAEKEFHATITAALLLSWLDAPKVNNDRIDGSLKVSNGSKDTFDLTVVIVAVATDTDRATAIGYQHFPLKPGTTDLKIPFGLSMPNGSYIVHADAIAEIEAKNSILRQRLQTPRSLQVAVGP
ncbi:MAG TPA: putative Ig domain-containing protein [Terriglobales bacterium]|nr:putative Ig domain-containing protein [Terriglobales bacterium]